MIKCSNDQTSNIKCQMSIRLNFCRSIPPVIFLMATAPSLDLMVLFYSCSLALKPALSADKKNRESDLDDQSIKTQNVTFKTIFQSVTLHHTSGGVPWNHSHSFLICGYSFRTFLPSKLFGNIVYSSQLLVVLMDVFGELICSESIVFDSNDHAVEHI